LSQLIDLSTGHIDELMNDTNISSLAFSRDGRYFGLGSEEGILHVFETAKPASEIAQLQHDGKVTSLPFSDDDKYVATASSNENFDPRVNTEGFKLRIWLLQLEDLMTEAESRLTSLRNHNH
jgi:WD40 repeat protein